MYASDLTKLSALEKTKTLFADIFGEAPQLYASDSQSGAVVDILSRRFLIEFKPSATTIAVSRGIDALQRAEGSRDEEVVPLLVVPYMSDSSRHRCRKAGISWLDLSGNAVIRHDSLFVLVEGKPNRYRTPGRPRNPFAPKSSRIVRTLLQNPEHHYIQKDIAEKSDVSKALVSQVVDQLEVQGFVRRLGDGSVEVVEAELLVDEWRDQYSISDHKITRGHIHSTGQGPELVRTVGQRLNEIGVSYAFTGLSSAWHYAPFASFRLAAVFVDNPLHIVNSNELGFAAEPKGANIWLVEPNDQSVFWRSICHEDVHFASPLQTYLDLKGHPERAAEASANMRTYLSENW